MKSGFPFVALWCQDDGGSGSTFHILTQDIHLTTELPYITEGPTAVEEFLPDLVGAIPSQNNQRRWALLLEPSLPPHWQVLLWESLTLMGRPLGSQALVVRCAKWTTERTSARQSASFLNLFPQEEYSFTSDLRPSIISGNLQKSNFLAADMRTRLDVLIMAHGKAIGLVDAAGDSFTLPVTHPMPERIWLLACNVNGAMDRLAKHLLAQGCRTVVCATGDLSAPEVGKLVNGVFADDSATVSVSRSQSRLEAALTGIDSPGGLTVWGEFGVDQTTSIKWNYLTWTSEHGKTHANHLDDETGRDEFFEANIQVASQNTWPLTKKWMLPPLLWLAETHHHPAMRDLAAQIGDSTSPSAIRGLAAAARRVGNYRQMARYLSLGLSLPDLTVLERSDYLGSLANLFIDMNLPDSAISAIQLHEDCNLDSLDDQAEADFMRLDWLARAEARRGRLDVALDCMTTKRKRAKIDTGRELAWQLYLATWGYASGQYGKWDCSSFADEVMTRLSGISPKEIGFGNETTAYLVRALAAHVWIINDPKQFEMVRSWLDHAEDRLTEDDPGPWAYTIAYMHYLGAVSSECFDRAIGALERARYYLEAASLSGFDNRVVHSKSLLDRFQKRRYEIVKHFDGYSDSESNLRSYEIISRSAIESKTIGRRKKSSIHGTLPL